MHIYFKDIQFFYKIIIENLTFQTIWFGWGYYLKSMDRIHQRFEEREKKHESYWIELYFHNFGTWHSREKNHGKFYCNVTSNSYLIHH